MRQQTGPTSSAFRRWVHRGFIISGATGMCIAMHIGLHGAITGRFIVNLFWGRLQAWMSLAVAALCLPAAAALYILPYLLPAAARALDSVLPLTVRSGPQRRKRRDSDEEGDVEATAELARDIGWTLASAILSVQQPDTADAVFTGFLAYLWNGVLAGPLTLLFFDSRLATELWLVFLGIVMALGLGLAAIFLWCLIYAGFHEGAGGKVTSTIALVRGPLAAAGAVAAVFVALNVDRGSKLHWSPFDA
jgi:hypothetical protein